VKIHGNDSQTLKVDGIGRVTRLDRNWTLGLSSLVKNIESLDVWFEFAGDEHWKFGRLV